MSDRPLDSLLRDRILADGPIKLGAFMAEAVARYYAGRDPFGAQGDFITAPEISQSFGEVIGLWAAVVWQMIGAPETVMLVELGPGRGTLMADLLRAAATLPAFRRAIRLHLLENSPTLRERQQETLAGQPAVWIDTLDQVPPGPVIIIANEFFDALPIEHYIRRNQHWHERLIGCDETRFFFVDGPQVPGDGLPPAETGDIAEVCPAGRSLAQAIGQRLIDHPGAALVIDYGYAQPAIGDSLQALRRHASVPPLEAPGEVDLTAHVDFAALAQAADPAVASPIIGQGLFLRRLGIEIRTERLAAARPDQADTLRSACQRLIDPRGMGTLFKVLALSSQGLPALPGFAE
jgi:NADH dehydrogenase [ubiquinone] 1 alpha subcomplex assembly factor 7